MVALTLELTEEFFNEKHGIERVDAGFRVERDIILTPQNLEQIPADVRVPDAEQYRSLNTVNTRGKRVITLYIPQEGSGDGRKGGGNKSSGFSPAYETALAEAIGRFNAENLNLSFQRVSTTDADIVFTRLSKGDENQGDLISAGFPSNNGDPYGNIGLSGVLQVFLWLGNRRHHLHHDPCNGALHRFSPYRLLRPQRQLYRRHWKLRKQ